MEAKIYVGQTIKVRTRIKDDNNQLKNPDTVVMRVHPPTDDTVEHSTEDVIQSVFLESIGRYVSYFEATEAGVWTAVETTAYENDIEVKDIEQYEFTVYATA
jgi:hypothetical protein